jgi:hypothetical protein
MTRREKILGGLFLLLVVIVVLFLTGIFKKRQDKNPQFDAEIELRDRLIEEKEKRIEILHELAEERKGNDSALINALRNNQPKIIINEQRLKDVPDRYRDVSKDDLRSRAINY